MIGKLRQIQSKDATKIIRNTRIPKIATKSDQRQWEKILISDLTKAYSTEQREYFLSKEEQKAQFQAINFVCNENSRRLFSLASTYADKRHNAITVEPDLFLVVLKYISIFFAQPFSGKPAKQWEVAVYGALNFLPKLIIQSDAEAMGYYGALRALQSFLQDNQGLLNLVNCDEYLKSCETNLNKYVSNSALSLNELDENCEEYDYTSVLKARHRTFACNGSNDGRYDDENSLVNELNASSYDATYNGPFNITQSTVEDQKRAFTDQLKSESGGFFHIKNISRTSTLAPMEKVIKDWRWKQVISTLLQQRSQTVKDSIIKTYLTALDFDQCAESIIQTLHAFLSQSQNLIPSYIFELSLANSVSHRCYQKFLEKLNISADSIASELFSEYSKYFNDSTIAQKYTLREWWKICSAKCDVDSQFALPFSGSTISLKSEIGRIMASVVIDGCKVMVNSKVRPVFLYDHVAIEEDSNIVADNRVNVNRMIRVSPFLMKKIEEHEFEFLQFSNEHLPMRVPPRPWSDGGKNGPSYTKSFNIIRVQPDYSHYDVNRVSLTRLTKPTQARPVFDALNILGTTPWIVNDQMLEVLSTVFSMCRDKNQEKLLNTLNVPHHSSTVDVMSPAEYNLNAAEMTNSQWREFYKSKRDSIKKKNETHSLWCWLNYRVALAHHFKHDVLYFPHNMDFRGRVYPISPMLNHMGDDVNRCLLKFAKGKRLGERGLHWLKLHTINITGLLKKKTIDERVQYAEKHLDEIVDSANNPFTGRQWWLQSEEPWQTLAACIELRDALKLENPHDFISHLPIHQDGSCNGLQHYAALGRDKLGAAEVNLLPLDAPADVYSSVASRVEERRILDEQNSSSKNHQIALELRQLLPQVIPRKVIKQTVMTTVYGVTQFGARQQIKKQLKSLDVDNEIASKFANYLTDLTFQSLNDAFAGSMQIKEWLRDSASTVCKLMQTVEWTTPLGLPVVQPYLVAKSKLNKVFLSPVPTKQVNAFPPNYVHSLDSTHMMLTALHCHNKALTFAAVHDCFWTHAATVDEMNSICRDQFCKMHSLPLINKLADDMKERYLSSKLRKVVSPEEIENLVNQLSPNFKYGDLDLDLVKQSVYFFS